MRNRGSRLSKSAPRFCLLCAKSDGVSFHPWLPCAKGAVSAPPHPGSLVQRELSAQLTEGLSVRFSICHIEDKISYPLRLAPLDTSPYHKGRHGREARHSLSQGVRKEAARHSLPQGKAPFLLNKERCRFFSIQVYIQKKPCVFAGNGSCTYRETRIFRRIGSPFSRSAFRQCFLLTRFRKTFRFCA